MKEGETIIEQEGCLVRYWPDFIASETAEDYFYQLEKQLPWQQYPFQIFGKTYLQPRLIAWIADQEVNYRYSGRSYEPSFWTKELLSLKEEIAHFLATPFNSVLANYYRNGDDYMGPHRDNEKELGTEPTIASMSLGEKRAFVFHHMNNKKRIKIELEPGSLLAMQGLTQDKWKHSLPKRRSQSGARINLTFRHIFPLD